MVITHWQICLNAVVNVDKTAKETKSRPSIIRSYVATGISMETLFSQLLCTFHLTNFSSVYITYSVDLFDVHIA